MAFSKSGAEAERRRYFRIEDEIILSYRAVPADDVPETGTFREHEPDVFTLAAHLEILSAESATLLRKIEREDSILGDYLRILEQKMDLVARALVSREDSLCREPARQVNLSASGLSFASEHDFAASDVLELRLVLPPALVGIHAYGRIVYCRPSRLDDAPVYKVGVDFIGLRDQDRDLLIRHVIKKQSQQLREHRQESGIPRA
jgi:hypothetical protein